MIPGEAPHAEPCPYLRLHPHSLPRKPAFPRSSHTDMAPRPVVPQVRRIQELSPAHPSCNTMLRQDVPRAEQRNSGNRFRAVADPVVQGVLGRPSHDRQAGHLGHVSVQACGRGRPHGLRSSSPPETGMSARDRGYLLGGVLQADETDVGGHGDGQHRSGRATDTKRQTIHIPRARTA